MAYNNKNFLKRRAAAVRLANEYYEPGRQDRCYKWVWRKYIRPVYQVEYKTFMLWIAAERAKDPDAFQCTLFDE